MAKKNDEFRGAWHSSGLYWMCDCPSQIVLKIYSGEKLFEGKAQPEWKNYCSRCQIYRPLKRDKPSP